MLEATGSRIRWPAAALARAPTLQGFGIGRCSEEFMNRHSLILIKLQGQGWRELPLALPEHPGIAAVDAESSGQIDWPVDSVTTQKRLQGHVLLVYQRYDKTSTKKYTASLKKSQQRLTFLVWG